MRAKNNTMIYGNPASIQKNGNPIEFHLPIKIDEQMNDRIYSTTTTIVKNRDEREKFILMSQEYLLNKGIHLENNLDTDPTINNLRTTVDPILRSAFSSSNPKRYMEQLKVLKVLPENYFHNLTVELSDNNDPEPKWVVVPLPAYDIAVFAANVGVGVNAGAVMNLALAITVYAVFKTKTVGFVERKEFLTPKIYPEMENTLREITMMTDAQFAHEVDHEIIQDIIKQLKSIDVKKYLKLNKTDIQNQLEF